ncbi:hypothetical protein [Bacillus paranthracis]|uniref:hypothetical protein n=1 Tax=Bacillus paranthracis TaxID=2026186 RepID=UPI0020B7F2FC|nr:hypothetical protein MON10_08425 [Bacillus paranthracis]
MKFDVILLKEGNTEHKQFASTEDVTKYVSELGGGEAIVSITSTEIIQKTTEYTIAFDGKLYLQEKR